MNRPSRRSFPPANRLLLRALLAAFASILVLAGMAAPATAGPVPPTTFPPCKDLLDYSAYSLFHSPIDELPPTTLTATWDSEIKRILYDNPKRNCKWSAVWGKVIIDFTIAYITPAERAEIRARWLAAYGSTGVNVGGDNWIYHRTMPGSSYVESAAVMEIPYYVTAVANDGTYFPAFIQGQADRAWALFH